MDDEACVQRAIAVARQAMEHGNKPFGAVLVADSTVLTAENTTLTENDPTAHAEINLVRLSFRELELDRVAGATIYASTEPCPMCAGAIAIAGIDRVVYCVSSETFATIHGGESDISCKEVLEKSGADATVVGPVDEKKGTGVLVEFYRPEG